MGTIEEKLNKLKSTKENIANALTEKGASVTSSDTFVSYADKIESIHTPSIVIYGGTEEE